MKKNLLFVMLFAITMASWAQVPPISHIEANNVRGVVLGNGTAFMDVNYQEYAPNPCPTWEVPVGQGKSTVFQKALWFGGLDGNDSLHLAAVRYGQGLNFHYQGQDYWSGPLKTTDATLDLMTALKYHHIWSLTRSEIEQFRSNFQNECYQIPEDILTWQAHGEEGYAENIAPFVDVNG